MAYESIGDVQIVKLGGTDAQGNKNPTSIEGYYQYSEDRDNKFNKHKPQKFYVFKTEHGLQGIYGKGGLDKLMASAVLGVMTLVTDTGKVQDVGKGNPMKVYTVKQDKTNTQSEAELASPPTHVDAALDEEEDSLDSDDVALDEVVQTRPTAPRTPIATPDAARQARAKALLSGVRAK